MKLLASVKRTESTGKHTGHLHGTDNITISSGTEPTVNSQANGTEPTVNSQASGTEPTVNSQASGTEPTVNSQANGMEPTVNSQASGTEPTINSQATGTEPTRSTRRGNPNHDYPCPLCHFVPLVLKKESEIAVTSLWEKEEKLPNQLKMLLN
ncbi:hypothetical protein CHS0354_005885 [Potamilus streckersoni]|uniref:Uncharacterized protein n=1 Tax=Potamilus streckersoni TaxID=2493646 RepID=A0AAE0W910_9BIVA|nr:hypothetical protein CHS0354_005885 [Potamilus streckersoni]